LKLINKKTFLRTKHLHSVDNTLQYKKKILIWAQQFEDVLWLDSNNYEHLYSSYDAILAVDAFSGIKTNFYNAFEKLKTYYSSTKDWIFGYISYDLKNDVEVLNSNNFDGLGFSDLFFFQPKKIFLFKGNEIEVQYLKIVENDIETDLQAINASVNEKWEHRFNEIKIKGRISKEEYFKKVDTLLSHIKRGDLYEANFCQEFFAEKTRINPLRVYNNLNAISATPFATFFKNGTQFLLSASPERYLKKEDIKVISQPIKGTAKRDHNIKLDAVLKSNLALDEKERSENIMIVDLVRNDLSQTAIKGSVNVEEFCKVYSFEQVHQMISTVVSKVSNKKHPIDIIKTTFPMGSMTGAPKVSAMKIIETLEETKRGLYSGTVGYLTPNGDFDFNVVIRSILYNQTKKYLSYSVGSAITAKSDPNKEYEECLIKAKALRCALEN